MVMSKNSALNFIKVTRNNDENRYYNFSSLIFVQNGNIILQKQEIDGFLLCEIDYGKSIKYIAGKNTNLKNDDFYAEFDSPFKDYFLIFINVSYGVSFGHLMDWETGKHYNFTRTVFHNGVQIEERDWCKPIPLISPYNELLWDNIEDRNKEVIVVNGKKYVNIQRTEEFSKYLSTHNIIDDKYLYFYFHKRESLSFYMAYEFCIKNAYSFDIIQNKFEDDIDTVNYCAKFEKDKLKDIAILYKILNSRRFGGKLYFDNLYGTKNSSYSCCGSAIYNVPYSEYIKGLDWIINLKSQYCFLNEQKANFKELVNFIYKKYEIPINYHKLPEKFTKNLIYSDEMLDQIDEYIDEKFYHFKYKTKKALAIKEQYLKLKSKLIKEKKYSPKWKSELDLFELVYQNYKDAIYQYRSSWLGMQSIDIYVPSKKLAFEYQGQQHYEPIGIWGGEEGLKKRQKLDEQKRHLCKENNVKLIEWRYDEPISKIILKKKIGILYE